MRTVCLVLLGALAFASCQKLNQYNIDPTKISTSGISSGGAFANQIQVAYSASIIGAAIVAGPPYYCAEDQLTDALVNCMNMPSGIQLSQLISETDQLSEQGQIDNTQNLTSAKIMLFTGADDTVVQPGVMAVTNSYYQHYVPNRNIQFINKQYQAEHGWPTLNYGNACGTLGSPYIVDCNYDWSGALLNWIYGNLSAPTTAKGQLIPFDQSPYTNGNPSSISFGSTGLLYVPTQCASNTTKCWLHVSFHGCNQGYDAIKEVFAVHSGLLEWAESNNIFVLYPQATASEFSPMNPEGCFDWYGYGSSSYYTKQGPQMNAVANMVQALVGQNVMN